MQAIMKTPHMGRKRDPTEVRLAIIHYTGSDSFPGTVSWFQDERSKVSAHWVIGKSGELARFGDVGDTLWHAGRSWWGDQNGCNAISMGYELVGVGPFTDWQYETLVECLAEDVKKAPNLKIVVGHEHVSPGRKIDPGITFDWYKLLTRLSGPMVFDQLEQICVPNMLDIPVPERAERVKPPEAMEVGDAPSPTKPTAWQKTLQQMGVCPTCE